MRRSGRVNHQDHQEEGPEKTCLQHTRGQRRRLDMMVLVLFMPGSSDDHLRQPATETDVVVQSIVMDSGTVENEREHRDGFRKCKSKR